MNAKLLPTISIDDASRHPTIGFSKWLNESQQTHNADVPCGSCNACCRSSYFIHIAAEETDTLRHIPASLLFAAPGLPKGNLIMGYNEHDSCPMLVDDRCSIYAHRPQTCRDYDCRVFAATGLAAGGQEKAQVNEQAASWLFKYASEDDRQDQTNVKRALAFLLNHRDEQDSVFPTNPTQIALLAVALHKLFGDLDAAQSAQDTAAEVIEFINTHGNQRAAHSDQ